MITPFTKDETSDIIADSWCELARPPITQVDLPSKCRAATLRINWPPAPTPPGPNRLNCWIQVLNLWQPESEQWPGQEMREKGWRSTLIHDYQTKIMLRTGKVASPPWHTVCEISSSYLPASLKKQIRSKLFIANPSSAILLSLTNSYTTR